jgi:hypothetical protein
MSVASAAHGTHVSGMVIAGKMMPASTLRTSTPSMVLLVGKQLLCQSGMMNMRDLAEFFTLALFLSVLLGWAFHLA